MNWRPLSLSEQRIFLLGLSSICLFYLIVEWIFIPYSAISADEFVFARHIHEYLNGLPYRDFPPYKTVLGYYLLTLPFYFFDGLLKPIFYMKDEIAVINAGCLILFSCWASRFFNRKAVLFSLLLILCNQFFLMYSTDLRVDMLTSWGCLTAMLFIFERRFFSSGLSLGLAFLISQKALWYIVAINTGLIACCYFYRQSVFNWRAIIKFNLAIVLPVLIYFMIWSWISSPSIVFENLFYEAYIQAGINWYLPIYLLCWQRILSHGTLLFFFWPVIFITLFYPLDNTEKQQNRLFLIVASTTALIQFISYLQPFPYNFVFTMPAFFLIFNEIITWLIDTPASKINFSSPRLFKLLMSATLICALLYIITIILFKLSFVNLLNVSLPVLLFMYLYFHSSNSSQANSIRNYLFSVMIITGLIYPLYHDIKISAAIDGTYQQTMLTIANDLLTKQETYVAGIPYFYDRDQSIDGMKNLIGPALEFLYQPDKKLEPLLLPSLYLAPIDKNEVVREFMQHPIKLILNNYRIEALPDLIKEYLFYHYYHYYGSIYVYAPVVFNSQLTFELAFSGNYRIFTRPNTVMRIDNKRVHAGEIVHLSAGNHMTNSFRDYRLIWQPDHALKLSPEFQHDQWKKMIRPIVM